MKDKKYIYYILMIYILLSIIIFTTSRLVNTNLILSSDFYDPLASTYQFDKEYYINASLKTGLYNYNTPLDEPVGFSLLVYQIKSITNIQGQNLGFLPVIIWPLYIISVFCLSNRLFHNTNIALLSSFFSLTIISGSRGLGPLYSHSDNLMVLLIIIIFLLGFSNINNIKKIFIMILFSYTIFITDQSGSIAFFSIVLGYIILSNIIGGIYSFFEKFKKSKLISEQNLHINIPLLSSFFVGLILAFLTYFRNVKVNTFIGFKIVFNILSLPQKTSFQTNFYLFILIIIGILLFLWLLTSKIIKINISPETPLPLTKWKQFLIIISSLCVFFIIGFLLYQNEALSYNPITIWNNITQREDQNIILFKQLLYLWHLNILPLILLFPSLIMFFFIQKKSMNSILVFSLSTLFFIILIIEIISGIYYKIERMLIYLYPFIFILTGYGFYHFIKPLVTKKNLNRLLILFIIMNLSVSVLIIKVQYDVPLISSALENGIIWQEENIGNDKNISSFKITTRILKGYGKLNSIQLTGLELSSYENVKKNLDNKQSDYMYIDNSSYEIQNKLDHTIIVRLLKEGIIIKVYEQNSLVVYKNN